MTFQRATTLPVLLALAALVTTGSTSVRAQALVLVTNGGNDAAACTSPPTACASFAGALFRVADGGTITCLNPADYANITTIVTKSVTIDCLAGGGALNARGLTIDAPGKTVRLRNLALNRANGGSPVLDIVAAASVHLENVVVAGSAGIGIHDRRVGEAKLFISDSSIVANRTRGILIAPQASAIYAVLDNVRVRDSDYGIAVGNGGRVVVKRSVVSGNFIAGIFADAGAVIGLSETLVFINGTGIVAQGGSTFSISNSDINTNVTGISGSTRSYGNNRFFGNTNDGTPPTPVGSPSSENGLR